LTKKRVAAGLSQIYGPKAVESGLSQAKGNISFIEDGNDIVSEAELSKLVSSEEAALMPLPGHSRK